MINIPILDSRQPSFDSKKYFENSPSKCDASKYHVYSIDDAKNLFSDRLIYIWGGGQKGRGFYQALKRCGFFVEAFLDSDPKMIGGKFLDVPIINPKEILDQKGAVKNVFILVASVDSTNKKIFSLLNLRGFTKGLNFEGIQALCPFYPTIEISGLCNLKCSSCPRSDESLMETGKYMSASDYKKVITKMVAEIPFLYLVDLYVFGEPLLNKELPDIIKINNELGLASGLSTNLNNIRNLEAVLGAYPAQLRVSLSGTSKETYEVTHTGGRWDRVSKNLKILAELSKKFGHRTIVEIYFHVYKHNLHEIKTIEKICIDNKFRFHPSLAVLFSDYAQAYSETNKIPFPASKANELMLVDIDTLLDDCKKHDHLNCILTRIVPVINWDLTVMPCCNYSYSSIIKNYLDVPLSDILNIRTNSEVCAKCQSHSLHRWNDQIYYSKYIDEIVKESS